MDEFSLDLMSVRPKKTILNQVDEYVIGVPITLQNFMADYQKLSISTLRKIPFLIF